MVDFLSHWLRGLILVIFLAVILDMILPSNSFQKYARLVMGLVIIFLMLTPVLQLYNHNGNVNLTLDSLLQSNGKTMESLDQIEQQGKQLQQKDAAMSEEEWKTAIVDSVKREVAQDNLTLTNINLTYSVDSSGQPKSLDGMQVTVTPRRDPNQITPIQPVAPVKIGGGDSNDTTAVTPNPSGVSPAPSQPDQAMMSDISNRIAEDYHLSASQIKVIWQSS